MCDKHRCASIRVMWPTCEVSQLSINSTALSLNGNPSALCRRKKPLNPAPKIVENRKLGPKPFWRLLPTLTSESPAVFFLGWGQDVTFPVSACVDGPVFGHAVAPRKPDD